MVFRDERLPAIARAGLRLLLRLDLAAPPRDDFFAARFAFDAWPRFALADFPATRLFWADLDVLRDLGCAAPELRRCPPDLFCRPAARAANAPTTPPTTAPTGPATLPTTAPAAAPAASFRIGGN